MRKLLRRIMSTMLVVVLLLSSTMVINAEMKEEKIYLDIDINDDFADSHVYVVIFHEYSGLDKEYSSEDFPGVDIESIEYITSLKDPDKEYKYLNKDRYRQILQLNLKNPGKENVIEAIKILEENPIVMAVEVESDSYLHGIVSDNYKIYGDVNFDKILNADDALLILKTSARISELDEEAKKYADVNFDGNINSQDALCVLQAASGIAY